MKHLADFLTQTNTSQAKLADQIGVSRAYMSQLVGGIKTPSLSVAVAIERATGGRIKAADWTISNGEGAS